jgi:hypothetical protein
MQEEPIIGCAPRDCLIHIIYGEQDRFGFRHHDLKGITLPKKSTGL